MSFIYHLSKVKGSKMTLDRLLADLVFRPRHYAKSVRLLSTAVCNVHAQEQMRQNTMIPITTIGHKTSMSLKDLVYQLRTIFRPVAVIDSPRNVPKSEALLTKLLKMDFGKIPRPPNNPFAPSSKDKEKDKKANEADKEGGSNPENEGFPQWRKFVIAAFVFYSFSLLMSERESDNEQSLMRYVSWNEFVSELLSKGEVKQLIVHPDSEVVIIQLQPGAVIKGVRVESLMLSSVFRMKIQDVDQFEDKLRTTERELAIPEQGRVPISYQRSSSANGILVALALLGIILFGMSRGMNAIRSSFEGSFSQFTKAKFTIIDPTKPGSGKLTSFRDVAGMEEAKKEVMEFVDYLRSPKRFQDLGAKPPRGALLLGPPGCGKTLLAKAVAAEAQVPFLTMAGSEFVEMIGGLGAARVRDLFKEARKRSPCIVYIDELDAMGRRRSDNDSGVGSSGEEEQTLNQLLVEMDGMSTTEGVIMLASTNRADILDKALLRPGRFDRQIDIDPPTAEERKAIFEVYLQKLTLEKEPTFYSPRMAKMTPGMSGADIANVVNEAALHAAREGQKTVGTQNFEHAVERVTVGTEKKSKVLQAEERRVLAYHEAGHALCGWLLQHTDALMKVSITPRTNSTLGYAQYVPSDIKLYSKEQLFDRMCMTLGGRVAELIVFNRATTGAEDDLKKVTKMALRQIRCYGMNETIGNLSFDVDTQRGGDFAVKPYSKSLGVLIDSETRKMVHEAFRLTEDLLRANLDKLELVSLKLLEKEVLNFSEVESLIGPPAFPGKQKMDPWDWEMFTAKEGADDVRPTDAERDRQRDKTPEPKDEDSQRNMSTKNL